MTRRKNSEEVADVLRRNPPLVDDLRCARLERGVVERLRDERMPPKRTSRGRSRIAAATLVAAAAAAAIWVFAAAPTRGPGAIVGVQPLAFFQMFSQGELVLRGTVAEGNRIDTQLGQRVEVMIRGEGASSTRIDLGPESSAWFAEIHDGRYLVRLERGVVDVAFHPENRGQEHLVVETGSARVEVVGTEFNVEIEPGGATRVQVRQGQVRVLRRGDGTALLVSAGEQTLVDPQAALAGVGRAIDHAASPASVGPVETTVATTPSQLPAEGGPPTSAVSSESSRFPAELEEQTVAEAAAALDILAGEAIDDEAAQLPNDIRFTLAERLLADGHYDQGRHVLFGIAREPQTSSDRIRAWTLNAESYARQGRFGHAMEAYRRAADGASDSAEGLRALYSLARLKEQLEDPVGAEAAYRRYLGHAPNGAQAAEARNALCRLNPSRCER